MTTTSAHKILYGSLLSIPPIVLLRDTFYSTYTVKNDSMAPTLMRNDVVLVRKVDFFPYYRERGIDMEDLETDNGSPKIDEETDRVNSMLMEKMIGKRPIDEYTIWSSPPTCLPGDVVAFKNPTTFSPVQIDMKRIVGLGGQRVRHILDFE
eukprot:CAMPEP_0203662538 /NCGR_PEP_ID=MMETSP0090-20130426/475_1 /ASSEMBLY_ACC=CAM_ASM_001088 /TAXON_ID=426623 /ORGANISM="Chaetoceros affinis, Strain CCMP159" /LENGTH=150 /DNA_ID=CAMNT_0050525343 /DNA_START=19 /DNA_END=471 /DNA_ORIENTATION=+